MSDENWRETVFKSMQETHDEKGMVFSTSFVLGALVRMLHDKGVLSDQDRTFLHQIWDWEPAQKAEGEQKP